jgi:hypothetical protein
MSTTSARYIISPAVRFSSDEDGTTLLHITDNRIYGLVGVGNVIWQKLGKSKAGLAASDIVRQLGSEFRDVATHQLERDVVRLLDSFEQKHLVETSKNIPTLKTCLTDCVSNAFLLSFNKLIRLLSYLRMYTLATFLAFTVVDLILRFLGFKYLYDLVRHWPTAEEDAGSAGTAQLWAAICRGITWYPKQVMCLQRSVVTTWLFRSRGLPAQMVIGCQRRPFLVHAWTELNGEVVNDRQSVREVHKIIDRC